MVPFLDLNTHHRELALELRRTFTEALRSGEFVGGRAVQSFEEEFARFCGTRFCIGVGSGTDALRFALTAAGVREGDAVITVPNTFIATTEAISQAGAYPLFVDVDPRMYTISTHALAQFLQKRCEFSADRGTVHRQTGRRVSAIVPVHLYGQLADMDAISSLADRYRCAVVEDACQAHGATAKAAGSR